MKPVIRVAMGLVLGVVVMLVGGDVGWAWESFQLSPHAKFILGMEWGYAWLTGEFLIPAGGRSGSGTRVDVANELGSPGTETTSVFCQGDILDRHLVGISWLTAAHTSEKTVSRGFVFHNKTYEAGMPIESKLEFHWIEMGYGLKVPARETWWLAWRLGVHHIRHALTINGETLEAGMHSNTRRLDGTYPVLGWEGRFFLPMNFDLSLQAEGVHMITRGFLSSIRVGGYWRLYPDVVVTVGAYNRQVHYLEDNQPLNNEWYYSLWGASAGVSFTF